MSEASKGSKQPAARRKEPARVAVLAGATGLIGRELLPLLLQDARYTQVHVLLRRAVPDLPRHRRLSLHQIDFSAPPTTLAASMPAATDVCIALGTTIKVAGSQAAFRAVDFDAVVNTARAARAAGATRLAVVSALGADAKSGVFYNRVKGEMQAAVAALGYTSVVFAQPSLLVGNREALGQPARAGEVWAARLLRPVMGLVPASVRPIGAGSVARALLRAMSDGVPGVYILSSARLQVLGRESP